MPIARIVISRLFIHRVTHLFTIQTPNGLIPHNDPLLPTLPHSMSTKIVTNLAVYSKVIHNQKLGLKKLELKSYACTA